MYEVFTAAFEVIEEMRFHTEVGDGSARALFFRGRCARQPLEEAQLLRFDPAGLIHELTLFGRPLPGVTAVMLPSDHGCCTSRTGRSPPD